MKLKTVVVAITLACGAPQQPHAPSTQAHWGYQANDGPTQWAALDQSFAMCGKGHEQSPIDLPSNASVDDPRRLPSLRSTPFPLSLVGWSVDGNRRGRHVHARAVPLSRAGRACRCWEDVRCGAPRGAQERRRSRARHRPHLHGTTAAVGEVRLVPNATVDLGAVLGNKPRYFHYSGSLTTPPCTEGVEWYVIDPATSPATLSDVQLAKLSQAVRGDNHRPTQPLGSRTVTTLN